MSIRIGTMVPFTDNIAFQLTCLVHLYSPNGILKPAIASFRNML